MLKRRLLFHTFETTGWFFFAVAAVVLALLLIVMLMRYERRLVPQRIGNALLALRIAVLLSLFLTLLQPVIAWTLDREHSGRILVALDLSESMQTADSHAGKGEKLRWARAMGMVGNADINERLDRWIQNFDEGREPQWVDDDETSDPQRREKIVQARQENIEGIFAEIDRLSRQEIGRRLLTETASPLLQQLQEIANVELRVFAGRSESAEAETLQTLVDRPPASLLAGISDLAAALSSGTSENASSPLIGVVLLSDGRDNGGQDAVAEAVRLGKLSAPVFPIVLGSRLQPKDLAIASLDFPKTAFKDDNLLLTATLNTAGFEGEEIEVRLEREGAEPSVKTITPLGRTTLVEFELDASEVGRHEYTVRAEVRPGETRGDNNSKSFAMMVTDDTVHALLLEGEARWEFRFIDNALLRDQRVQIEKVVFRQPYIGVLPETFFPRNLELSPNADDLEASPFAEADLVIVGDVAPDDISQTGWKLLQKFVAESGGTLVLIAGKQYFPLSYKSEIIDELLPMTNLRTVRITGPGAMGSPTERGFHLKLTPEGASETMLQFDTDVQRNREIWAGLPGHLWGLLGKAKPAADVFAYALQPGRQDNLSTQQQGAVIVRQIYGAGQVLWLGIDSTWLWRHRVGDKYHHRFWGQLARWSAENKVAAGNEFVKFGPDQTDIEAGDEALLRARWSQAFLKRNQDLKARVLIFRADQPAVLFTELPLEPVETRPLMHEARVVALLPGEYRLKLVVDNADLGPDDVEALLFVNDRTTPELSDLSSNRALLSQLADVSGGRLVNPDQIGEIPSQLQNPDVSTTIRREIGIWDHWLVMLLFFALMTAEWVIRKLNGLP